MNYSNQPTFPQLRFSIAPKVRVLFTTKVKERMFETLFENDVIPRTIPQKIVCSINSTHHFGGAVIGD